MAGAIPILPTREQFALLRRLKDFHLGLVLMEIDEHGWDAAQDLLHQYARRPEYQQSETLGEAP